MIAEQTNWAGNYTYGAARIHAPTTVAQIQALVSAARKAKVLGSRHSFNDIADTSDDLISLEYLDGVVALDPEHRTVTVEGGMRYGQLAEYLHNAGYALHNLASLPHISIAGACATATHGSGDNNGNLATAVKALEIVTADGEQVALRRDTHGDQFNGAVVGLGGLGVITKLSLEISPTFMVRQDVYENLPFEELEHNLQTVVSDAYSVSLLTDWQSKRFNQVWVKREVNNGAAFTLAPTLFGATLATTDLHPIAGISPENCTPQLGVQGPWHERLPHFRMNFTPSNGEELQSEYFVPRHHAFAAFQAVEALRDHLRPILQISEVRTIAADDLWMSPCYHQACVALHFTWRKDWDAVKRFLPTLEAALAPFEPRPHWAKLFTMSPAQIQARFPKLNDFRALLQTYDPQGKFRNAFLDTYIF